MDAKQFLAEFGHIANAPDGVQRIRELILKFAVQGRLVEQIATEGHSKIQLDAIKKISTHIYGKSMRTPKFTHAAVGELENNLPSGWSSAFMGELVRVLNGRAYKKQEFLTSGMPILRVGNLFTSNQWYYSDLELEDDKYCNSGDLLYAWSASFGPFIWDRGKVIYHYHIWKLDLFDEQLLNKKYLYVFLLEKTHEIKASGHGIAMAHMTKAKMEKLVIPIPPLKEQSRIVAKVDELMVLCDKLEAQQQQKRKLQNHLRQSTFQALASAESSEELQVSWKRLAGNFSHLFADKSDVRSLRELIVDLAVRGLLSKTENGPRGLSDNSIFLDEVKKNKSGRRFAKMQKPKEVFKLPQGWIWVLLEDLLSGSDSGWSPKCDSEPRQGVEWGVLKVSSVTWGKFNHDENKRLPLSLEAREEHEVLGGDFLLSRANTAELVARSVIVPDSCPEKLMMSDKIVRLNFTDTCVRGWVNLVNNSSFARTYYREKATGTSDSMRNVSRQVIHELPIPFPPVGEQVLVLEKVRLLTQFCDSLEAKLTSANKTAERLATASIASLTGMTATQEETPMKAPKTELKAPVRLGKAQPSGTAKAPLASLLSRHNGEMNANDLWQRFGGEIDAFYAQLKTEVSQGWIAEPSDAEMLEKEID